MSISTLVCEDPSQYTHHDQLFKELIHTFFEEFLEAFFPEVHHFVDFNTITTLSGEVFTDLIDGESKKADIVIETKLKGKDTVIIIHVEPQSYGQPNFQERMYHYFSLLYNKYRKPIIPIAVFSYDENRKEIDKFIMEFPFFHVLTFQFLMVELRKMNWRNYIKSNNPVSAALLSKMGYSKEEKVQVKKEFLRMLTKMELNPAKSKYINDFFEQYLKLDEREEERLLEEIKQLDEAEEVFKLSNSWEERGRREEKKNIAIKMFKEGASFEFIAKVTGLDKEVLEKLSKK